MLTFGVIHRAARKGQKVEVRGEGRHSKKTSLKQNSAGVRFIISLELKYFKFCSSITKLFS
jgi:hypothetical protein